MKTSRFFVPLATGSLLFAAGCHKPAELPAPFNVRAVAAQPLDALPREGGPAFLGVVRADAETSLSFKVTGQIVRIGPRDGAGDWGEGVAVPAGAELAQLDTANFVSAVAAARARADLARATFSRNSELYAAGNLARSDFDASRAQKDTAEADLAQAEQALRDTTLRAPYAGVILSRSAESGEFASAGRAVLRLGDFRRAALEIGVPDTLLGDLDIGQPCAVRVSAFEGEAFTGVITEIGTAADQNSRLFRVVLQLDNAAGRLRSGMTASVRLGGQRVFPEPGVVIPLSALVAASGTGQGAAVYVVTGGRTVNERPVRTADIIGSSILVTGGLAAGEQVVTLGAGQLYDGAAVAVTVGK